MAMSCVPPNRLHSSDGISLCWHSAEQKCPMPRLKGQLCPNQHSWLCELCPTTPVLHTALEYPALLSWITTAIMITIVMWLLLFCWGETRLAASPASFIWISSSMLLNASGKDCAALIVPHPVACRFCQRDVCMQLMGLSGELWPWGSETV